MKTKLNVEQLEYRLVLDALPHPDNPVLQKEHLAVFALVPHISATHTAVSNGDWDNAATWDHGIPTSEANVLIPQGITVTLDSVQTEVLRTIRVDGTFQFSSNVNTGILVDTMIVDPLGSLVIGTHSNPIQNNVSATITFADRGAIDTVWDPNLLSRGLISHGTVTMYGMEKTSFLPLAQNPIKNSTQLVLSSTPNNWNIGDKIVLAGTNPSSNEDEQITILGVDGNTLTVNPLAFSHLTPSSDLFVHVANLTRNIVVQSQNSTEIMKRGHVMFMHSPRVNVDYVSFVGLGRTDKTKPLNNVVLDSNGQLIPGTGTNQVGRYSVHFHRTGVLPTSLQQNVIGSVVDGSPGWGFVNHSSNVNFTDNVAFNAVGAGFVTEVGDEIGQFVHNFSLRQTGSGKGIGDAGMISSNNFGHEGNGFWFQGPGVTVKENVVAGSRRSTFFYFNKPLAQQGLPTATFLSANLADPSIANGATSIPITAVPIREFSGNVGYAANKGLEIWHNLEGSVGNYRSYVDNFTVWGLANSASPAAGFVNEYNQNLTIRNSKALGNLVRPSGVGGSMNAATTSLVYENVHIEGFEYGVRPTIVTFQWVGGLLNNVINVHIVPSPIGSRREVHIDDPVFETPTISQLNGRTHRDVFMDFPMPMKASWYTAAQDRIFLDDAELFFLQQARDFVPFPVTSSTVPTDFVGKTNLQIWNEFGMAISGVLASEDAFAMPGSLGLIGSPVAYQEYLKLISQSSISAALMYTLKYQNEAKTTITDPVQEDINLGLNVITREVNGETRSWIVTGT